MRPSQPLPRLWLMTDERLGEGLLDTVARLPDGAGIVFRHYSLAGAERRALFEAVKREAPGPVLLGGAVDEAASWGADGSHGRHDGATSAPVHDLGELRSAERAGAALLFLSPVYATRSHPDAKVLGPEGFAALASRTNLPVVALGGMDTKRAEGLEGAYGWAGIDCWAVQKPSSRT